MLFILSEMQRYLILKKVSIYFASEILFFDWLGEERKWIPGKAFL